MVEVGLLHMDTIIQFVPVVVADPPCLGTTGNKSCFVFLSQRSGGIVASTGYKSTQSRA
jgi:hypothetical protein